MKFKRMRKQDFRTWQSWFAWFPVPVRATQGYTELVVWLEIVERRYNPNKIWEYRQ